MKKILLLLIITAGTAFSQSGWQSTFESNPNEIISLSRIDENNLIAFTNNSRSCIRSTNSGVNWFPYLAFDTICSIRDSKFTDSKNGWCAGYRGSDIIYGGIIYKTTDGGYTWTRSNPGSFYYGWWSLDFINSNTGWIGGIHNKIIKTTNGGKNWIEQVVPNILEVRSVNFLNENLGWACGRTKWILKTTNGGNNWIIHSPDIRDNWAYLESVYAADSNNCWVTGQYVDSVSALRCFAAKTTNGGTNWITIFEQVNLNSFRKIYFLNSSTGYLYGYKNYMLKTTNEGLNWNTINTGNYGNLYSIDMISEDEIIAGGGNTGAPNNFISVTANAGNNWSLLFQEKYYNFNDIQFLDLNTGVVVGDEGSIYKTINSGINWEREESGVSSNLYSINFINDSTGFAFGANGTILKTINTGNSWTQEVSPVVNKTITSSSYDNDNGVWAVGVMSDILRTTNAGNNWTYHLPIPYHQDYSSVQFIDDHTGWILGHTFHLINYWNFYHRYCLYKTSNGGQNWVQQFITNNNPLQGVKFIDSLTGYMNGGSVWKTIDGGSEWETKSNLRFSSLSVINSNELLAGESEGSYGTIYKSVDGGSNWSLQFSQYGKKVWKTFIADSLNYWFVGSHSSIYKTTDGGGIITSVNNPVIEIPDNFHLLQNYPNPFNPVTRIAFEIPYYSNVNLVVYDLLGREVRSIVNEKLSPGKYTYDFDGSDLPSGVYFYRIKAGDFTQVKRMVLVK